MTKGNIKKGLQKHQHCNTLWKWSLKASLHCSASPGASDLVVKSCRSAPEHSTSSCHHAGFTDERSKVCYQSMGVTAGIPVTLVWMSPMGKKNPARFLFITLVPENLQALENEVTLPVSSLSPFPGSNLLVFLPACIVQSSLRLSPACRHAQGLLSHRPPLGRLSHGSCTTYISERATCTAQVTWSQTKLYVVFLLGSGDFRSTARASVILTNYWQDIILCRSRTKKTHGGCTMELVP